MTQSSKISPRVLVVEDEYLIRMLLEDMLAELGYGVAAAVGTIAEASEHATKGDFDAAMLDVNLDGQEIYPVADILANAACPSSSSPAMAKAACPSPIAAARLAKAVPGRAAQNALSTACCDRTA